MSIPYALLSLLAHRPMFGYQLRAEFESSMGSTWPLNVGQVYTTLARLERDDLVEVSPGQGEATQRVYAITEAGREQVQGWFATPVQHQSPPRDELAIKLALAVRSSDVDIREVIQTQRAATMRALQEYTRARENARDDLSWLLVAESLIFAAESEVRWLDHCETRLVGQKVASAPRVSEPARAGRTSRAGAAR